MPTSAERSRERRWVVLGEDGRYVTLGRNSDPTEVEILAAEAGLQAQGLAGWLAVMEGNPHVGNAPALLEVRPLASPSRLFSEVAAACVHAIMIRRSVLS